MSVSFKLGNRRLLALADLLETVKPAKRLKSGQKRGYDQGTVLHECGSPACAWGWWAHSNPSRNRRIMSEQDPGNIQLFDSEITGKRVKYAGYHHGAMQEFALTREEAILIFSGTGCNYAHTNAKKAANFIRAFVLQREAA